MLFQFTLPRGERCKVTTPLRDGLLYFNPRSHEGSDEDGSSLTAVTIGISIHAPTRGATGLCGWNPRIDTISIHAPTRGATLTSCIKKVSPKFQSTLPQGERQPCLLPSPEPSDFNPRSHKGSDVTHDVKERGRIYFNPRSHKGSDPGSKFPFLSRGAFQSTLPQGERRRSVPGNRQRRNFNPRSHKGSD